MEAEKFADRLQSVMWERGITQEAIARAIGVTRQSIGKYLKGQSLPTLDIAVKVADYLAVSLDWLSGREGAFMELNEDKSKAGMYLGLSEKAVEGIKALAKYSTLEELREREPFVPECDDRSISQQLLDYELMLDGICRYELSDSKTRISGLNVLFETDIVDLCKVFSNIGTALNIYKSTCVETAEEEENRWREVFYNYENGITSYGFDDPIASAIAQIDSDIGIEFYVRKASDEFFHSIHEGIMHGKY